jgi:glycosyltransferase involved in cell wall biosynthesis
MSVARGLDPAPPAAKAARAELDVLAVIDHLAVGGAEMLLGQFAAAAPSAGIRLKVAHLMDADDGHPAATRLREAGIDPVNLDVRGRPGARHLRAMRRHIRAVQPDIVHTHLGTSDLVGGLAARSLGVPTVSTIHAIMQRQTGAAGAKDAVFALSERWCAARVIVVSDSARRAYLNQRRGMDRRVVRIYNGIDLETVPGSGAAVRHELGIRSDDLLVGMVSALRPEKGHDIAIEAIAKLRASIPRLRLLIAGQGRLTSELARLAEPLGDSVILAGYRADVPAVFDALDVCIHPSRLDAFPTTLIEALAASVPVLATAVGGIPEIIDDGRTGVLVPAPPSSDDLAHELSLLLADPARRDALADAGRSAYLERFTARPWLQSTRALYDAVLEERRQHTGTRRQ